MHSAEDTALEKVAGTQGLALVRERQPKEFTIDIDTRAEAPLRLPVRPPVTRAISACATRSRARVAPHAASPEADSSA